MIYDEVKFAIDQLDKNSDISKEQILRATNSLSNNKATINQGRDLVIRLLSKIEKFNKNEKEFIVNMIRNVGLFPYITDYKDLLDPAELFSYEAHRAPNLNDDVVFHSLQAKVYRLLISKQNVILSAATSVGKSLIIDAIVAAKVYKKIVLVVPTIALIDETRRRIAKKFSEFCNVITHQSQEASENLINVYVLTQERVLQRNDLNDVSFFVIDEFYKLDLSSDRDANRAIDLNLAFEKLSSAGGQFYLLGPNIQAIRGLEKHQFVFVPSDFTTVAVDFIPFNLPMRGHERQEKLIELCQEITSPTIIYCQSPSSANFVSNLLIENLKNIEESSTTTDVAKWIAENFHPEWDACKAIKYGIGIHHGGVPRALQQHFIRLFNQRVIKFLVCTSTIIEGVNTSAENVIIYDRRKDSSLIDYFTYKNISGRAGRMGQYFVGKVFMLEEAPQIQNFTVDFPVGLQNELTPLSLLMELRPEVLSDQSKERLDSVYQASFLSRETLIANRHISVENQTNIAKDLYANAHNYQRLLSWRTLPNAEELELVCNIIYDHLLGDTLKDYNIHTGSSLAWHVNSLRMNDDLTAYLNAVAVGKKEEHTISQAVSLSLRFIRNIICYRLPRELTALSKIQTEVFSQLGRKSGDFTFFANQMETMFASPLLYALDEFGIPLQISRKLERKLLPADDLNQVLRRLRNLNLNALDLSPFEIKLTKSAIEDV